MLWSTKGTYDINLVGVAKVENHWYGKERANRITGTKSQGDVVSWL